MMEGLDIEPKPCVRCGYCCQKAVCMWGQMHMSQESQYTGGQCSFLEGEQPGEYSCKLITDEIVPHHAIAIGAGCSSSLCNTQREEAVTYKRLSTP